MEIKDLNAILNAMPETGVYVIREEDRALLYINERGRKVSPKAALGMPCYEAWTGTCRCCPLPGMDGRQENHTVSYNASHGGIIDISAARILWEDSIPAFVVTVVPRKESAGYTYRKILHVDLRQDRCDVLKSDPEGWLPSEDQSLSAQLEAFARSGAIHPEDVERFTAFTRLDQLRAVSPSGEKALTYRRRVKEDYRWNLMELVPDMTNSGQPDSAILCMKDVHNILREGLEREGLTIRGQELIRSLGERNFNIYTIDLESGSADSIRVDGQMQESLASEPWKDLMRRHIKDRLHEAYQDEFDRRFSLEALRLAKAEGRQKSELLCQWRSGEDYRYISVTAYFSRESKTKRYTILALQDVDERTRQELVHTKRNMQMAAILKSRYQTMMTVSLDSGQYEQLDLAQSAGPEETTTGDYNAFLQTALSTVIHPDDLENSWALLSLEHLREKAENIEDYAEEICLFRLRGQPVRWMELHVIYSRRKGQVMVNILEQDVTKEKVQEESQQQALEDRTHIISSLSILFFSTYYIDLEQDTFRAVRQLRRVTDLLGEEVNYTAALQIYANHFIHPDDREEYLRTMSIQNLRQTLRWWQPCVAMEYRRLPEPGAASGEDAPASWVRASAVLARTGADDMPKTVVYVAQDISINKHRSSGA